MNTKDNGNQALKAILFIAGGIFLFLYTLGIVGAGLNVLVMIGSLALIAYGFLKLDAHTKLRDFIQSMTKKK